MPTIHVVPIDDLIEHNAPTTDLTGKWAVIPEMVSETDPECVCGLDLRLDDGWWIHVHHALDGRE